MFEAQFSPGQKVTVAHMAADLVNGVVRGWVAQMPFDGVIVGYWRNDYYLVRGDTWGDVTAFPQTEITTREGE